MRREASALAKEQQFAAAIEVLRRLIQLHPEEQLLRRQLVRLRWLDALRSAAEGAVEEAPVRDDLCRTQVSIHCDEPIDGLLTEPLGNHHVLLPGRHRGAIETFFARYLAT
jgi:hypothetical protein